MPAISNELAVRLGLAARAIPEVDTKELVQSLLILIGEPITVAKLNRLKISKLKQVELLTQVDDERLEEALNFLKGRQFEIEAEPLPSIEAYEEGDMPESVRIACSSNTGEEIDGHFGSSARYLIYQVNAEGHRLIDIRLPPKVKEGEDKNAVRADILLDCQILYTMSIGGPAAAKVVKAGIHPIKIKEGGSAPDILTRLSDTLAGTPPPWLAKVMGSEPEERIRYREGEVY